MVSLLAFTALGTAWSISIDQPEPLSVGQLDQLQDAALQRSAAFEARFSRFQPGSEVRAFATTGPGSYSISPELTTLLAAADRLRQLTHGAYDPAVGGLLEAAGYTAGYRLTPDWEYLREWQLPLWQLDAENHQVTIDRPVIFDLGGIGKGYWIDQLSQWLLHAGYLYHLVDGGGDMMATTKADGTAWQVAIEYPGQPELAIGRCQLRHQGFAASDTHRRRWGDWHHLLDPHHKVAVSHLHGVAAVAPTAWEADQTTSFLSVVPDQDWAHRWPRWRAIVPASYLAVLADGRAVWSSDWPGEVFV